MFEIQVRLTCAGWKCRQAGLSAQDFKAGGGKGASRMDGKPTAFVGWLQANCMGSDNMVVLKKVLPKGWVLDGTSAFCPICEAWQASDTGE